MITKRDALNLIDTLNEWAVSVQPKELEDYEIGLNDERFFEIHKKLHNIAYGKYYCNYTIKDIKKAWSNAYNEDIRTEYKGFISSLKKINKQKGHKK